MSTTRIESLRISHRWMWTGPVAAIVSMIAVFVYGIVIQEPALMVIASSLIGVAGAIWGSSYAALNRKIAEAEAR